VPEKNLLDTAIEYLKGVGPARAEILKKEAGIFTFQDLLYYFPFRYVDRSKIHTIASIRSDLAYVQVKGTLVRWEELGEGRKKRLAAYIADDTGTLELVWFKGIRWIKTSLETGTEYLVFGRPQVFKGRVNIPHPEMEKTAAIAGQPRGKFEAVYPSTEKLKARGLNSKGFLKLVRNLFDKLSPENLPENIPGNILTRYKLAGRFEALKNIHLPENEPALKEARRRLKFEELFILQVKILGAKWERTKLVRGLPMPNVQGVFLRFYQEHLPFQLTNAQKRVLKEIRRDLLSGRQMNRLLQGDVGSGKTIVALMTMLMACDNGFQAVLMAPTEILAQQHFSSISRLLEPLHIPVALLTGSVKGVQRRKILEGLKDGRISILIGTHALIEEQVDLKNPGLVIIDEQHRFGVAQRARLAAKSSSPPHILVMTATPIPRTLAMTVYGDLDVSVIDEMPPGRKPVTTVHRTERQRPRVYSFIRKEIEKGHQVYIVYPLISESAKLEYKALMEGYETVAGFFPPNQYRLGVLHGQMKPRDKEMEMQRFTEGKTQILISTTVIEVGVDVPNATVMLIESAERFGLSQLHQLRGRIGRGASQSLCILLTPEKISHEARRRMQVMAGTSDGFKIAEVDLELRGPGEIEGTLQSGHLRFAIADLKTDHNILVAARDAAKELIKNDPELLRLEHKGLKKFLETKYRGKTAWGRVA